MNRRALWLILIFSFFSVSSAVAQTQQAAQPEPIPAATQSDIECSGFMSPAAISKDLMVANGADNDFFDSLHQFVPGDDVYLQTYVGSGPAVGSEWRLVRPASESFTQAWFRPGLGGLYDFDYVKRYPGQAADMRAIGKPFMDIGRVRVTERAHNGFVARVEFACQPVHSGDIAIPYEPRQIPTYLPASLDRFGTSSGLRGVIAALPNNATFIANGGIAYIDLGRQKNVKPGDRFRIIRNYRTDNPLVSPPELPPETVGQLVVLWTQPTSSVGIVVSAHRGVNVGDIVKGERE